MSSKKGFILASSYAGVAAVWLGGHFGPGFATGAFSVTYFVKYGWWGLLLPLLAMVITGFVMYEMVEFGRKNSVPNYRAFCSRCYGKKLGSCFGIVFDILFLGTMLCAGGLAFSGEANVLQSFGFSYWGTAAVTIIISALLCIFGPGFVSKASKYMMYSIIAVVMLIAVVSLARGGHDYVSAMSYPGTSADFTLWDGIFSAILYGCFQSTIVFNVLAVSNQLESRKETAKAIVFGYIVTVILMISIAFTIFGYVTVIPDICNPGIVPVPIMAVLMSLDMPWLTYLFVILMTLAVLTSAAGLANSGCVRFDRLFSFVKNAYLRRAIITVILLTIAAIGASFGMKVLLQKGTTVIGYIGIVTLVIPSFTIIARKNRESV